jgi:hypothetical protein
MTVFKTDNGDYDVSKMSDQNQYIFTLAQNLISDIRSLSDDIETKKAALEWFKAQLGTECTADTKITYERARDEEGKFIGDDPDTPENEAYVRS